MFEQTVVVPDDAVACAEALGETVIEERRAVARRFALVAAWADLHCPEPQDAGLDEEGRPLRRAGAPRGSFSIGGADGTPEVTRAGVVELGMRLGISAGAAISLIRDVLETRHRLPVHWEAVHALQVDGWKARQVARATHSLDADRARTVDAQVIGGVTGLPWGRAQDVVGGCQMVCVRGWCQRRNEDDCCDRRNRATGLQEGGCRSAC